MPLLPNIVEADVRGIRMPPPNMRVRFLSLATKKCLAVSEKGGDAFHRDVESPGDDMYFVLKRENSTSNRYNIIHDVTGKCLYSDPHGAGVTDDLSARWFEFEQGTGRRVKHFRLLNRDTYSFIFSRTTKDPQVGGNTMDSPLYDDQYFAFIFEDMAVSKIEYKIPDGLMGKSEETIFTSVQSGNHTPESQRKTVDISKTLEEESSFESALGFSLTVGTEFKTGLPGITEGKISMELSTTTNFTWGSVHRSSITWTDRVAINMQPFTNYKVVGKASRSTIDVPFIATLKSPMTGETTTMEGMYKGVAHFDFKSDYWPVK